jgi:hypothetical protein
MVADYIQALENEWQSVLAIRGFGLMDSVSQPVGGSTGGQPGSSGIGVALAASNTQ